MRAVCVRADDDGEREREREREREQYREKPIDW